MSGNQLVCNHRPRSEVDTHHWQVVFAVIWGMEDCRMCKDRSDKSVDHEVAHAHCLHFPYVWWIMQGRIGAQTVNTLYEHSWSACLPIMAYHMPPLNGGLLGVRVGIQHTAVPGGTAINFEVWSSTFQKPPTDIILANNKQGHLPVTEAKWLEAQCLLDQCHHYFIKHCCHFAEILDCQNREKSHNQKKSGTPFSRCILFFYLAVWWIDIIKEEKFPAPAGRGEPKNMPFCKGFEHVGVAKGGGCYVVTP